MLVITGCQFPMEIIDGNDSDFAKPLAKLNGITDVQEDPNFSSEKLKSLTNKRWAIIWQVYSHRFESWEPMDLGPVDSDVPYPFNFEVKNLPRSDLLQEPFIIAGKIVMYSDVNGDEKILTSDLIPEESIQTLEWMKKTRVRLHEKLIQLHNLSEKLKAGTTATITIMEDNTNKKIWLEASSGKLEQEYSGQSISLEACTHGILDFYAPSTSWKKLLDRRTPFKIKWPYYSDTLSNGIVRHQYQITSQYKILKENFEEFRTIFSNYIKEFNKYYSTYIQYIKDKKEKHWEDYPFDHTLNKDWIAGASAKSTLLFFKDEAEISELKEAINTSTVYVNSLKGLQPGYQLVHCESDLDCVFAPENHEIKVNLCEGLDCLNNLTPPSVKTTNRELLDTELNGFSKLPGKFHINKPPFDFYLTHREKSIWLFIPPEVLNFVGLQNTGPIRLQLNTDSILVSPIIDNISIEIPDWDADDMDNLKFNFFQEANAIRVEGNFPQEQLHYLDSIPIWTSNFTVSEELPKKILGGYAITPTQTAFLKTDEANNLILSLPYNFSKPDLNELSLLQIGLGSYVSPDLDFRVDIKENELGQVFKAHFSSNMFTPFCAAKEDYQIRGAHEMTVHSMNGISRSSLVGDTPSLKLFNCNKSKFIGTAQYPIVRSSFVESSENEPLIFTNNSEIILEVNTENKMAGIELQVCPDSSSSTVALSLMGGTHPDSIVNIHADENDYQLSKDGSLIEFRPLETYSSPYYYRIKIEPRYGRTTQFSLAQLVILKSI